MAARDDELVLVARGEFDDLEQDLEDLQVDLANTKKRAEEVGADGIDIDASEAIAAVKRLRKEFEEAESEGEDPIRVKVRAKKARAEVRELRTDFRKLSRSAKKAKEEVIKLEKEGSPSLRLLKKALNDVRGSLQNFIGNLASRAVARFVETTVRLAVASVQLRIKLEALPIALAATLGGTDRAAGGMKFLDNLSQRLGISIAKLSDRYVSLTAATSGSNIAGAETDRIFEQVIVTGRALGRTNEQIARGLEAVEQIAGKTTLQAEELRKQLGQAIPGAIPALAKALGKTVEGFDGSVKSLFKWTEQGKLTAEIVLPALADGLEALGGKAAEGVADRLAAQMGRLEVAGEKVGLVFAEKITPGLSSVINALTESINETQAGTAALGEMANILLGDLARGLELNVELANRQRAAFSAIPQGFREAATEALAAIPGMSSLGAAVDSLGDAFSGLPQAAAIAFEESEKRAILSAQGIKDAGSDAAEGAAQSFLDLQERAFESFKGQTEAAELSAGKRKNIEQQVAAELIEIDEQTTDRRKLLRRAFDIAYRDGVGDIKQLETEAQADILRIVEETGKRQRELVAERVQDAQEAARGEIRAAAETSRVFVDLSRQAAAAADKRIAKERQAGDALETSATSSAEAALEAFRRLTTGQAATADERRAIEEKLADQLTELELDLVEKKAVVQKRFLEAVAKGARTREEIERETLEAVEKLDVDASQRRAALTEARISGAKKVADAEIKERERVVEAERKAADAIREILEKLTELREPEDGGEGERQKLPIEARLDSARESAEQLATRLETLRFGEDFNAEKVLELSRAFIAATLNVEKFGPTTGATASEYEAATSDMRTRARQLGEAIDEMVLRNEAFRESFKRLGPEAQEQLLGVIASYRQLAESGQISQETLDAATAALLRFAEQGEPTTTATGAVVDELIRLKDESAAAAGEQEKLKDAVTEVTAAAKDEAEAVESQAEANARATKEVLEKIAALEDGAEADEKAASAAGKGAEAIDEAAEAHGKLATKAAGAAAGVGAVRKELDGIAGTEVPETVVEDIRAVGEAGGAAAVLVDPLGTALDKTQTALAEIAVSATTLQDLVPKLLESITTILKAIEEGGVQERLAGITAFLENLRGPLEAIGSATTQVATDLPVVDQAVRSLTDSLPAAAKSFAALAEGGSIQGVADQTGKLKAQLEPVVPAVVKLTRALVTWAENGEPVAQATELINGALQRLTTDESLGRIDEFVELLESAAGALLDGQENARKLDENLSDVEDTTATLRQELDKIIETLSGSFTSALDNVQKSLDDFKDSAVAAGEKTKAAFKAAETAAKAAGVEMDELKKKTDAVTESALALVDAYDAVAGAARRAGEAGADL